jgi:hypothetical protein
VKQGERNAVSRFFHSKADQAAIAGWGRDFDRILHIFNVSPDGPVLAITESFCFRPSFQLITTWYLWTFVMMSAQF